VSKKYEKEISLRLYGDKVEAQKYILRAREVLGEVWNRDIELGGLDQAWQRVTLDSRAYVTVYATRFIDPIVTITVTGGEEAPPKTQYLIKLAWKPEGIVLTPRTAAVPNGWGLPSRREDNGEKLNLELNDIGEPVNEIGLTEAGSLPQVILNRYVNNKYLDKIEYIDGLPGEVAAFAGAVGAFPNPQLSDSTLVVQGNDTILYQTTAIVGQPWSYATPDDGGEYVDGYYEGQTFWETYGIDAELVAGVHQVDTANGAIVTKTLGNQFATDFTELITENKAADIFNDVTQEFEQQWYCHRPEEKLYTDAVSEAIFQATNSYRLAAGEEVVYRMLRGDANSARMAGYVITLSEGHFFHSHPDFFPGFRTTGGRVMNCTGEEPFNAYGDNLRENIAATPADGGIPEELETAEEIGQYITDLWRNSPPHYANMVDSKWTDFVLPFHTWSGDTALYPNGTKGASHHIGSYGVNTYVDRSNTRDSSVTIPITPPAEDATLWAQLFCARSSWVPLYDWLHEGAYGTTGTFNGWNAYSHGNFVSQSRRVGWNKYVYQLPAGLVPPQVDQNQNAGEYNAFLSCIGSAMIEIAGEKWIRAVYWESDTVIETIDDIGLSSFPQEGDWVRMKVVRFPIKLMEASVLPWRETIPAVYELEYEYEWLLADGWFTNPPGKVVFNSTGDKFTFTMHKQGTDLYTDALDYFAKDWTVDRSALPLPRIDIQCVHYEWDETILSTLADMTAYEPVPLVATVECWTGDPYATYTNSDKTTFYNRILSGQIDVFPHYDKDDNLTYLTLDIDEQTYQKGNRDLGTTAPSEDCWCYRVRKLIFPSGKEITYMQQYMEDRWTTTFSTDIDAPNYRPWPGTANENFFCVIHWLDELNEDIVYSKIHTDKIVVDYNLPGLPYDWYRVDGKTDYIADLNPKVAPTDVDAEPQITETIGTIAYDVNRYALNVYDKDGDNWAHNSGLPDSKWIYNTECSPCTLMVLDDSRAPPGQVGANTTGFTIPEIVATTTLTFNPGPTGPPYDPDDGCYKRPAYRTFPEKRIDYPTGRPPYADYTVSNHTGYTYYGDSNLWYFGTGKIDRSFLRCNISPLFSKPGETRCKVIRYDDRIVVYVGLDHVHKFGLNAPEYFKPAGSDFAWSEWTLNPPPEGQEQFIWTNFDLDEAVGIEDITDIWPMGKIV